MNNRIRRTERLEQGIAHLAEHIQGLNGVVIVHADHLQWALSPAPINGHVPHVYAENAYGTQRIVGRVVYFEDLQQAASISQLDSLESWAKQPRPEAVYLYLGVIREPRRPDSILALPASEGGTEQQQLVYGICNAKLMGLEQTEDVPWRVIDV